MRISDWSSDVCSSDLRARGVGRLHLDVDELAKVVHVERRVDLPAARRRIFAVPHRHQRIGLDVLEDRRGALDQRLHLDGGPRSEEHTSELQSLMRISYAVFCLKKKKQVTK